MKFSANHAWSLTPKEAIALQKQLAESIIITSELASIRYVAGVDCAFSADKNYCYAATVLWDLENNCVVEQQYAREPLAFPYIPGLLSFREAPAMLNALSQLTRLPDVIMVDGHGIAHPRRLGIAAHLGVITKIPTLGCGKSLLVGKYQEPAETAGSKSDLIYKNEIIGSVFRTRKAVKPVFISVGNLLNQANAEKIVLACVKGYRLPEPTRLADKLVAQVKLL